MKSTIKTVPLMAMLVGPSMGSAFAGGPERGVFTRMVTDASGTRIVSEHTPFGPALQPARPASGLDGPMELWRVSDPVAIVERASLSGGADGVWGGFNLNSERLGFFEISGDGTPEWEFDVAGLDPDVVAADGAEDVQFGALLVNSGSGITVQGFRGAGGGTPDWTYDFPASYGGGGVRNVAVSDDGAFVLAAAIDFNLDESQVVVLEGPTGTLLNRATFTGRVSGVDLSASGTRGVLTIADTGVVVDLPGLVEQHSLSTVGQGGWQRISGDGMSVAVGGFDARVDRETSPGMWTNQVFFGAASNWFGNGMALSHDGSRFFVASHNYSTGYLTLTYRVFDTSTGQMTAETMTQGAGMFQDSVRVAHMSDDGSVMAVASWGSQDNVHPEVQVFDADLNRLGGIDSAGSAFDMSLSKDGRYVVSGTKSVHANTFGNGGELIVLDLGGGCYADCTGEGTLDIFDFLCFQDAFVAMDPYADCTGEGTFDIFDFLCFQDEFVAGCP